MLVILTSSLAGMAQEAVKAQKDQYFPVSARSEEAKQTFREALDFLWNARFDEYRAKSDEALRLEPQFFLANANRAIAEATLDNNKEKSNEFITKTLALPEGNLTPAEKILRQIVVALKDNKPDEMKRQADEMIRTYPNSIQAYSLAMAITREFTKDPDAMYGYAQKLLAINPNHGPTWNQVGYYHLQKGDLAQAKVAFDNYIRLNPNEANAYDSMGDYYLAAKEYDKASASFDKAASMGMTASRERGDKARELAKGGTAVNSGKESMDKTDWDKQTSEADKRAADIDRQASDVKKQEADVHMQSADMERQAADMKKQAPGVDNQTTAWNKQTEGIDKQTAGIDQQTGMNQPNQFLPVSSTSQTAIKSYHDAITRIGHADVKAYNEKLDQAIKEDPKFFMAQAHVALSDVIDAKNKKDTENGKADNSKASIETALAIPQQGFTPAELIVRDLLVTLKDNKTSEIKPLCDKLVQQFPENTEAYLLAVNVSRFILDDEDQAFAYCNQLLQINPNVGPAWNIAGYYHLEKGDLAQAKVAFDNYLRLNPNEANAHDSMGDYCLAAKQYDQSAMHFEKAVAMGMESSRERAEKARALAQEGAGEPDIEK